MVNRVYLPSWQKKLLKTVFVVMTFKKHCVTNEKILVEENLCK